VVTAPFLYLLPDAEIDRFLQEDCPYGDLTTALLDIGSKPGRIAFATRHEIVACCTEEAARLFERLGCDATVVEATGAVVAAGKVLLEARGSAAALHAGWKVALNLLEAACGIATRTRVLVSEARAGNPAVEVVATRKVFPGTKGVATKAVYAGGALPHRLGLSESVLIFAQHVAFLGGEEELWQRLPGIKERAKEKKVGIEVTDKRGALAAAKAGADIVQVDKLGPEELAALVNAVRAATPQVVVAAAGGVNIDNARAYAASGVDLLVTSSMYWGKPADIAVSMEALV
jgi:molybdenum transport protein